jgi:hypothetical protein
VIAGVPRAVNLAAVLPSPTYVMVVSAFVSFLLLTVFAPRAHAQAVDARPETPAATAPVTATLSCASRGTGRVQCPADTSAGVVLVRSTGAASCILGRTWGYDAGAVWVAEGCAGEFALAQSAAAAAQEPREPTERIETWGEFDPGQGFLVGRTGAGELAVSAYALVRYLNQMPGEQTFTDHLGNERTVDGRNDIFPHRVIVYLKGWVGDPRLIYNVALWTVNTTDQDAIFGNIGYQFSRKFSLYAGINGNPGTRSLQGSHPYWLGHDRVMADEFFRPFFASGVWAQGEPIRGLWYNAQAGNSNSALGIKAVELDRRLTTSASMWWMPTTKEFGPKGGYGDWEFHEQVATRFGFSTTQSREQRYTNAENGATGNTTLKLADSSNVFDTGALAPGVTVQEVDFRILAIDAGMKYRGVFLQTELYTRWLDHFMTDGVLPIDSILDHGFYVQAAFYPLPKKLELYGATSQIYGDKDAGFDNSSEYILGMNFYPANVRNHRFNLQVIDVNRSPVSSTFGYYVGGQSGTTVSAAFSVFF